MLGAGGGGEGAATWDRWDSRSSHRYELQWMRLWACDRAVNMFYGDTGIGLRPEIAELTRPGAQDQTRADSSRQDDRVRNRRADSRRAAQGRRAAGPQVGWAVGACKQLRIILDYM